MATTGRRAPTQHMKGQAGRAGRAATGRSGGTGEFIGRMQVAGWLGRLRERLRPNEYVDWVDLPDEPESPYRARLTLPREESPDGLEVRERDVVRGEIKLVYEVRCACGKRWFNTRLENVQICPRCGRAVLVQSPE